MSQDTETHSLLIATSSCVQTVKYKTSDVLRKRLSLDASTSGCATKASAAQMTADLVVDVTTEQETAKKYSEVRKLTLPEKRETTECEVTSMSRTNMCNTAALVRLLLIIWVICAQSWT